MTDHAATAHHHNPKHGSYSARFTDTDGNPLAGVVVFAASESGAYGGAARSAVSGRNGTVKLTLPQGQYLLEVEGMNAHGGVSDATGYVGTDLFTNIVDGRNRTTGTTVLRSGGAIRVHVAYASGRPIAGVHPVDVPVTDYVQPDSDGGIGIIFGYETSAASGRTDASGNVTLRGIPSSLAFQVCVNPDGVTFDPTDPTFLSACTPNTVLARAGRTVSAPDLAVERRRGAVLVGHVGARERNFGQAAIAVLRGRTLVTETQSAPNGRFRVGGLRPGTYRVCAEGGPFQQLGRTGYLPGCATRTATETSATSSASVSVVLRTGAAARGVVTGPGGVPVVGASISPTHGTSAAATSDSRGHYVLKGLPAGQTTLCAQTFDVQASKVLPFGVRADCKHHRRHFTARTGRVRSGLDLRLPAGGAVSGTVIDRRGRPVPHADVEADLDGQGPFGGGSSDVTANSRGHFVLTGLRTGRYHVCADSSPDLTSGFAEGTDVQACRHGRITVRTGRLHPHVRIVLPTTSAVRVTVRDAYGRSVGGVDATVIAACHQYCDPGPGTSLFPKSGTSVVASGPTDSHGSVLLDGLEPGHYAICLFAFYATTSTGAPPTGFADRCSSSTYDVAVRAGRTASRSLVLRPGGAVSGRITDAAGNPLVGVLVHVAGSAAEDVPSDGLDFADPDPDADGGPNAPPGYYSVTAADGSYTVRSVRPGNRVVCADPSAATGGSSDGGYLPQCVGGAVGSTAKGSPVSVRSGATTDGVDLALAAGAAIAGRVTSRVPDSDDNVALFRDGRFVASDQPANSGTYEFANLAPGTYTVCAASFGRRTERGRCYKDVAWNPQKASGPPAGATPVDATAGALESGIDIVVPR